MTRTWRNGYPIDVKLDRLGRPIRLLLNGRWLTVRRVEQHWQVDTDWWSESGRVWRDCYALTTVEGMLCVIYLDMVINKWWLEKVYD